MSYYEGLGRQHHQFPESGIVYGMNQIDNSLQNDIEANFIAGLDGTDLIKPLFESYTKLFLHPVSTDSIYFNISVKVLEKIETLEKEKNITKNKQPIYFLLALTSIKKSNITGALLFWELSQKEIARVNSTVHSVNTTISTIPLGFKTIFAVIETFYSINSFVSFINSNYAGSIKTFDDLLSGFNDINKISLISCGLQNAEITKWMVHLNNTSEINKLLAQELINALCILVETHIKFKLQPSNNTLGRILNNDLPNNLSVIVGNGNIQDNFKLLWGSLQINYSSKKASGLFKKYKTGNINKFNANFVRLLNDIQNNPMAIDEMKAHVLYGAYMVRNSSLHEYNDNLAYFNNMDLFQKTIGLLLVSLNIIDTL